MKKFLSIFLAMVLLIGGLPFESFADTTTGSPSDIRIKSFKFFEYNNAVFRMVVD